MRPNRLCALGLALFLVVSSVALAHRAQADIFDGLLGKGLKILGVGLVLDRWGDDINRFINKILGQRRAQVEGKTKLVELIRVGSPGGAVGAAQVMGPAHQVDKVQAVAELELGIGRFRGRALLPVTTKKRLTKTIRGVGGTGVSANIKFPL
ncbi:MAG: hypothetical protein ACE5O2_10525 [Armatimonadota bacterium]